MPQSIVRRSWLALPTAMFCLAGPLSPQVVAQDSTALKGRKGEWLVVPTDGKPGCRISLTEGKGARPEPDCKPRVPSLAGLKSWRELDDGLSLHDGKRRVLQFKESSPTILKTHDQKGPNYLMVRAKSGVDHAPLAAELSGDWAMRRPTGQLLCRVAFRDGKDGAGKFGLELDGACDAGIKKLNLSSWHVEDFALVLTGEGASLRFEPAAYGFEKIREAGSQQLSLVRPR